MNLLEHIRPLWRVHHWLIIGAGAASALTLVVIASGQSTGDSPHTALDRDRSIFVNQMALLAIGSIFSFITARYWWQKKTLQNEKDAIAADHSKTVERLHALELQLVSLNQAVIPISTAFQAILIKELTHFHTPEMDALMKKIGPPNTLTPEEDDRLFKVLLPQREKDMGPLMSDQERDAAHILPAVARRARAENEAIELAEKLKLQLVTIAAVVGVPASAVAAEVIKHEEN